MDDVTFDRLVRALSAAATRRRTLALVGGGLVAVFTSHNPDSVDARNRNARQRRRRQRMRSGQSGNSGDPGVPNPIRGCAADPATGDPGFACEFSEDGCSCGGECCSKGYSCFVHEVGTQISEFCCYTDMDSELPEDVKHLICRPNGDPDHCCKAGACREDGVCTDSPWISSNYRRKWR